MMNKKFNMRFFMFSGIVCTTLIPIFNLEYPFVLLILGISGILTSTSLIYELGNKWINFLLIMFLPLFVVEWIGGMELNYQNLRLFLVIFVYQNILVYFGLIIKSFTKEPVPGASEKTKSIFKGLQGSASNEHIETERTQE